jgi:hypothetical protein
VLTFSSPASGPSAILSSRTATTDPSGTAQIAATANSIGGIYNLTVRTGSTWASFRIQNVASAGP